MFDEKDIELIKFITVLNSLKYYQATFFKGIYSLFNKSEFSIFRKLLEIFELFFLMKVHSKDYGAITKAIQKHSNRPREQP